MKDKTTLLIPLIVPPLMVVLTTVFVMFNFQKLSEAQVLHLFSSIYYNMIWPIGIGILVGIAGGIIPYVVPRKSKTLDYHRKTWKWAVFIAFILGVLPVFGLIKSIEWMIFLGVFVVVTTMFYYAVFSFIRIWQIKKKRAIREEERIHLGVGA